MLYFHLYSSRSKLCYTLPLTNINPEIYRPFYNFIDFTASLSPLRLPHRHETPLPARPNRLSLRPPLSAFSFIYSFLLSAITTRAVRVCIFPPSCRSNSFPGHNITLQRLRFPFDSGVDFCFHVLA